MTIKISKQELLSYIQSLPDELVMHAEFWGIEHKFGKLTIHLQGAECQYSSSYKLLYNELELNINWIGKTFISRDGVEYTILGIDIHKTDDRVVVLKQKNNNSLAYLSPNALRYQQCQISEN